MNKNDSDEITIIFIHLLFYHPRGIFNYLDHILFNDNIIVYYCLLYVLLIFSLHLIFYPDDAKL